MVTIFHFCFCLLLTGSISLGKLAPSDSEINGIEDEAIESYKTILYKDTNSRRLVEIIYANNDLNKLEMVDCFLTGDKNVAELLLSEFPVDSTRTVDDQKINELIDLCSAFLTERLNSGEFHQITRNQGNSMNRGILDSLTIFPGTKWCGAGDVASHYEDLGPERETDMCCRTHDHCEDAIAAGGIKYGLKNKAIFTKSHCDCDREFRGCLTNANTKVSNSVGRLYNNLLQVQCFEKNYPIQKCLKYSGWIPLIYWSCQQYQLDYSGSQKWQFFDAKYFE